MRLVSQSIDQALTSLPNAPVNFGLLFNKFLQYRQNQNLLEPVVKQDRKLLISDYQKSKKQTADLLEQRHLQQAAYCQAMEKAGWQSFIVHAKLTSPFVSGLGMAHPTETGLVLDHTSGMPYIPAASQKGVLRVAYLINTLCDDKGNWLPMEELFARDIVRDEKNRKTEKMEICWQEDDSSKTLFGSGGDKDALAGQVMVLDAYPLAPPELGEEILNPHYGDYYQQKKNRSGDVRGPSEDQSPIPIKFLVVKSGADFVFRVLLRTPFANAKTKEQDALIHLLEKSLHRAITEEGMGAKTALGFGRFEILSRQEPDRINSWQKEIDEQKKPWLKLIPQITAIDNNWGQLQQMACHENAPAKQYQAQKEVAVAIKEAASRIKKSNPKKWEDARDKIMQEWLAVAGLTWAIAQKNQAAPTGDGAMSCSPEEQAAIEKINSISNWSGDLLARIDAAALPLAALKELQKRMKNDWNCDGKKVRKDKKEAWKQVRNLIKARQNG